MAVRCKPRPRRCRRLVAAAVQNAGCHWPLTEYVPLVVYQPAAQGSERDEIRVA